MIEAVGDLWDYPAEWWCVPTNGVVVRGRLVMGAGVALEAKRRYPDLPRVLGGWVSRFGNVPWVCVEERVISFPTKHDWRGRASLQLIRESAERLVALADESGLVGVVLPRPGCGLGGLAWKDVRLAIGSVLDDRFTVVAND